MKKNGFSHIRRWLWLYLVIVVLTTLATYILIYNQLSSALLLYDLKLRAAGEGLQSDPTMLIPALRLRLILLLTIGLLSILLLSIVWLRSAVRQIDRPLHIIRKAVFRLSQGKLNETVPVETSDEFGQIGSNINELAANLQELLLYIWKQTGQCLSLLETIRLLQAKEIEGKIDPRVHDALQQLTRAVDNLRDMAKAYVFYDVYLEGEKTLAINQPGQTPTGDQL